MFRKFLVFLASSGFALFLFLTVATGSLVLTLTPNNVKSWLKGSQVYDTIVEDLLKQSQTLYQGGQGDNPLKDPGLQAAAKQTFTPAFLQSTAEQVIDGTMPWLEGKVAKPTFAIDVAGVKAAFADNIGAYATKRLASLPVCGPGESPAADGNSDDVLTMTCRPAGYSAEAEIQKTVNELKTNPEFLADTTITADTLQGGENATDKRPLYEQFNEVPKIYQLARLVPLVLGAIALIDGLIIIFLSTERRRGMRRVAITLGFTVVVLLGQVWLVNFGIAKAQERLSSPSSVTGGLQTTGVAVLKEVQQDLTHFILLFSVGFLAVAALLVLYLVLTRTKTTKPGSKVSTAPPEELPAVHPLPDDKPKPTEHKNDKVKSL